MFLQAYKVWQTGDDTLHFASFHCILKYADALSYLLTLFVIRSDYSPEHTLAHFVFEFLFETIFGFVGDVCLDLLRAITGRRTDIICDTLAPFVRTYPSSFLQL